MRPIAPPALIEQLAAGISLRLSIANYNAPDQAVVGGDRPDLETLSRALAGKSHQARILAVPAAFHTPLMAGASDLLSKALQVVTIEPLRVPVVSTVTNAVVRNPAEIRRNLANQMTTPVRYAQLITQLAAEQPSVFIEVGPQQTLTRLNRRILDASASLVAGDNPKRPGLEALLSVQALIECLGGPRASASHAAPVAIPATVSPATLAPPVAPSVPAPKSASTQTTMNERIPHFDATERRRAKMRGDAPQEAASPAAPRRPVPAAAPAAPKAAVAPAVVPVTAPVVQPAPTPAPAAPVAQPAAAKASGAKAPVAKDLEAFLVNFVVDRTGYPAEVVDLDGDLEADLGIDSIKKAHLFSELNEFFDVASAVTTLSMDDFTTLRHVLDFLQKLPGQGAAMAPVVAATPQAVVAPMAAAPAAVPAPASVVAHVVEPVHAAAPAVDTAQLEAFLVNFVVERTGYPAEVVDLDGDLEADLGIDSIKKAHLFSELNEFFDVGSAVTTLSMDDFHHAAACAQLLAEVARAG